MAREGLRTLVVAKKTLTEEQYADFEVCRFFACFIDNEWNIWGFDLAIS